MEKIQYILDILRNSNRDVAAFHENDVFLEYWDKFHNGCQYSTALASFKKTITGVCDGIVYHLIKNKTDYLDRADYGVKIIWSVLRKRELTN